jgi:malate synthase
MAKVERVMGSDAFRAGRFGSAVEIFEQLITGRECVPFLTIPAYEHLD